MVPYWLYVMKEKIHMYSLVNSFTHRGVGAGWVYDLPIFVSRNETKDDNVIKKGWKYLSTLSQI